MPHEAQVIVVGAGPAGSTAACVLARAGVDVLLVEKGVFPRDKLCGGFLASRSLGLLEELHGAASCLPLYHTSDDRYQIWHGGRMLADQRLGDRMAFVQRLELDHFLARQAVEAGARLREDSAVQDLVEGQRPQDSRVRIALKGGGELVAEHLIVADGARSILADAVAAPPRPLGVAMELHLPVDEAEPPRLDFGLFPWGYGWRFPKRGCATVGVALWGHHARGCAGHLRRYLEHLNLPAAPASGWILPDRCRARLSRGRVLLAGDAAGLCEPISGEGIYFALRSGQRAALALLDSARTGDLHASYRRGTARMRGQMRASRLFRPFFHAAPVQERLLRAFCELPELRQVEWSDIFRVAARSLLFRRP